jgi:hypothetical protein
LLDHDYFAAAKAKTAYSREDRKSAALTKVNRSVDLILFFCVSSRFLRQGWLVLFAHQRDALGDLRWE